MEANPEFIESYVELVRNLQRRFPITGELTLETISRLPGAITVSGDDLTSEERESLSDNLEKAALAAIEQVYEMRTQEGQALVEDLEQRIETIRRNLETIRQGATGLLQTLQGASDRPCFRTGAELERRQ